MNTLSPELESVLDMLLVMADAQKTPVFRQAVEEIRDLAKAVELADTWWMALYDCANPRHIVLRREQYHAHRKAMRAKRGTE